MHETIKTAAGQQIEQKTENEQKTLYFTLSLYADQHKVEAAFGDGLENFLDHKKQIELQRAYHDSLELRDAVEPLFNDITDRERESRVEDFLLTTANGLMVETLTISIPPDLDWSTEGVHFKAELGRAVEHDISMRAFWYVHANGAISYHMSFVCRYEHTPEDFYFLSMLQKACAPKEFRSDGKSRDIDFLDAGNGIFPLDNVMVTSGRLAQRRAPFWNYVRQRFNDHARDLFEHEGVKLAQPGSDADYFGTLIDRDGFIEVPGLKMPRARFLFLFDDAILFRLLKRDERNKVANAQESVKGLHQINAVVRDRIKTAKDMRKHDRSKRPEVSLDRDFLAMLRANEDALRYYFMSGFCQNIIDFMNQDASEIRDSLDPIYPAKEEQEEENFFFRFANPRSMVQFVERSRSLNIGNDYIGTCPYAFLVHVASLHNEFLTRKFEADVATLTTSVQNHIDEADYKAAADMFYGFRTGTLANHTRYRYENVFRYDSESDCFAGLEKVRGIFRKETYLKDVVSNLESTTRDLEERQRQDHAEALGQKSQYLNWLVAGIGLFSILQVLFQILELAKPDSNDTKLKIVPNATVWQYLPDGLHEYVGARDLLIQSTFHLLFMILAGFIIFAAFMFLTSGKDRQR